MKIKRVIDKLNYEIVTETMSFYAYELKVPNSTITSDIVGFFAGYDDTEGRLNMDMIGWLWGCSAMSPDEIMGELEKAADRYLKNNS